MSDFQPGDMVVCVDGDRSRGRFGVLDCDPLPAPGEIVAVDAVDRHPIYPVTHLHFRDYPNNCALYGEIGFDATRFRKVYRPKADLIQRLTAEPVFPSPRVKEDA